MKKIFEGMEDGEVQVSRRGRILMSCVILLQRKVLKMTTVMAVSVSIQRKAKASGGSVFAKLYIMPRLQDGSLYYLIIYN
jgi:hypothetical protein